MNNFIYDIPTKVYFGEGQLHQLPDILKTFGSRILMVYGGGSIHRNGIYDTVYSYLKEEGKYVVELAGVEPNPSVSTVRKGVTLCQKHDIDTIIAIGGGSTIDCAKVVAAAACSDYDAWELVVNPSHITKALPILAIPTISATGSEMDHIGVISNPETKEKIGTRHPVLRPKVSILDPTHTYSVSAYQSACGVADIMSHTMESYFTKDDAMLQDTFALGILKVCIKYGPIILEHPNDYEARANLMWASSWAINDMLKLGHATPWSVHPMEHPLSAYYDVTHGEGLAILTPHWMEYVLCEQSVEKFAQFAHEIWQIPKKDLWDMARDGIEMLKIFYKQLGLRQTLGELGINEEHFDSMAKDAAKQTIYGYIALDAQDVKNIYQNSL